MYELIYKCAAPVYPSATSIYFTDGIQYAFPGELSEIRNPCDRHRIIRECRALLRDSYHREKAVTELLDCHACLCIRQNSVIPTCDIHIYDGIKRIIRRDFPPAPVRRWFVRNNRINANLKRIAAAWRYCDGQLLALKRLRAISNIELHIRRIALSDNEAATTRQLLNKRKALAFKLAVCDLAALSVCN